MKTFFYLAFLAVFLRCLDAAGALGWEVPGGTPGDSSLGGFGSSSRLQQVYVRGGFPTIVDSAFLIHMVYFRANEECPPFPFPCSIGGSARFSDIEVRLSTTSRAPDGLSTVFSENIGADETTVFGRSALTLEWGQGQYITGIPFDRPFLYNPAAGNLLLDIRSVGPSGFPSLDAFDRVGDAVSTVSTGLGADRPMGGLSTRGLATLFWVDIVPIPEPSTAILLLLSVGALGWRLLRVRKSSSNER